MSAHPATKAVIDHIEDAMEQCRPGVIWLGRAGMATKGVVYGILGAMTMRAALDLGVDAPDKRNVFYAIVSQPLGQLLLGIVSAGLLCFAVWRLFEAFFNPQCLPSNLKNWGKRSAWLGSGLIYGFLGLVAGAIVFGIDQREEDLLREWIGWGMRQPFGKTMVGIAGLCVIGRGIQQLIKSWRSNLLKYMNLGQMSEMGRNWTIRFGRIGLASRGIVFIVVGSFLVLAAWRANPSEARDIGQSMRFLEHGPYGQIILGVIAVGLICYGMYALMEARYRRIERPAIK